MCGLGSLCQASVLGSNSTIWGGICWSTGKLQVWDFSILYNPKQPLYLGRVFYVTLKKNLTTWAGTSSAWCTWWPAWATQSWRVFCQEAWGRGVAPAAAWNSSSAKPTKGKVKSGLKNCHWRLLNQPARRTCSCPSSWHAPCRRQTSCTALSCLRPRTFWFCFHLYFCIFFYIFCIFAFNCPRPRTCLPRSSPPCPSWTPWLGPAGSGCSSFPQVLEQRGVAGRGLGRRCRLLDQHIAPESWVQKHEFSFWITYICGERDIDAIVLSLLWRLHLVSLFCAGVLQYIRFFDIFLSFFSFIFGANEVIILA